MPDALLDLQKNALQLTLSLRSPLSYINQQHNLESEIALSIYIPDPILMKGHEIVGIKDNDGNE